MRTLPAPQPVSSTICLFVGRPNFADHLRNTQWGDRWARKPGLQGDIDFQSPRLRGLGLQRIYPGPVLVDIQRIAAQRHHAVIIPLHKIQQQLAVADGIPESLGPHLSQVARD